MNNKARTESTVGEIVNLMSVDCQHIAEVSSYLWAAWSSPLQIIGALIFLYYTVCIIWAATGENLSSGVCKQHRRRQVCTSAQSDQCLCYSLFGKYHM